MEQFWNIPYKNDKGLKTFKTLRKGFLRVFFLLCFLPLTGQHFSKSKTFKLSAPQVMVDSLLFVKSAIFSVKKGESDSKIFVQNKDGKSLYRMPLVVKESAEFSFWMEHPDFQTSDVTTIRAIKVTDGLQNAILKVEPAPNEQYIGAGWHTLTDLKKGSTNFRNGNKWLGFQEDEVYIRIDFLNPTPVSEVVLGVLKDHGSWIFLPSRIEVQLKEQKVIGQTTIEKPKILEESASTFIGVSIPKKEYTVLNIVIKGVGAIPQWHQGSGTVPWLFIDELLINP